MIKLFIEQYKVEVSMIDDLRVIKKYFGEEMMHYCRSSFPTILEQSGILSKILLDNFEPQKFLYKDLMEQGSLDEFKEYIYIIFDNTYRIKQSENICSKTPKELLESVGYDFYECHNEEEIQSFKKYYAKKEKLCTFNGDRLDRCYVFFAVKKNVEQINREDFKIPDRQDEYGTSVISIQFTRDDAHILSIKNRYNHSVPNSDATYSNNLDNIVRGLTYSFEKYYDLCQKYKGGFELLGYVKANDGKFYKYNHEINNIYYCPNNIIIDNFEIKRYLHEQYVIMDNYILDLRQKTIKLYDDKIYDNTMYDIKNINNINILNDKSSGNKKITISIVNKNDVIIEIDKLNNIVGYFNSNIEFMGNSFFPFNNSIEKLSLENLASVGNYFLSDNLSLKEVNFPKLSYVGDAFLNHSSIKELDLPELLVAGNGFLNCNVSLKKLNLPKVKRVGKYFLSHNVSLEEVDFPCLEQITGDFLSENRFLNKLSIPNLQIVGSNFLEYNESLKELNFPKLRQVGDYFLPNNSSLENINFPMLESVGNNFLESLSSNIKEQFNNLDEGFKRR